MKKDQASTDKKTYSISHILIIFASLALLIVSNLYIMIPLLEDVAQDFRITIPQASLSISTFSFFYACGLIFFGALSERFGLKETISGGLFILSLLMFSSFFTNSFQTFLVFRGIQGFFAASFAPVSYIYVLNVLEDKHHALTIGIINTAFLASGVFGQLISLSIIIFLPWKYIFLFIASMYIILFIYMLKKLPRAPKHKNPRSIENLVKTLILIPFRDNLKMLYLVTFIILLTFVAYYTALDSYLNQGLKLSPITSLTIRGFGLIGLVMTFFSDKTAKKFGYNYTIRAGLALKLTGLIVSINTNTILITLGSIMFVAGIAIVIPSLIQLIGKRGAENRGLAISMYSFILLLGASVGGLITVFSSYFIKLFLLAFLLLFAIFTLSFDTK